MDLTLKPGEKMDVWTNTGDFSMRQVSIETTENGGLVVKDWTGLTVLTVKGEGE